MTKIGACKSAKSREKVICTASTGINLTAFCPPSISRKNFATIYLINLRHNNTIPTLDLTHNLQLHNIVQNGTLINAELGNSASMNARRVDANFNLHLTFNLFKLT